MAGDSVASPAAPAEESHGDNLVAILLAMAMFVLVVDTSLMNVSISAVVHDLHTTASGVQSAIALEALVSAAFILTGSKIGDLFGRKRAYIVGLCGYAVGALSMVFSQSLLPIVICWAISFGLAFAGAIMLASLSLLFTHEANSSDVLSSRQATQVSKALEKNAEVMTNTHLEALLVGRPPAVKAEILRINTEARPKALQIALLVPLIAALLGLLNGFRMTRLPDPEHSAAAEGVLGG
jgi:phosphate/sulfate permease